MCPDCRFRERAQFVNPPKFWYEKCMCAGKQSEESNVQNVYTNSVEHFHGENHCPNEFETSYKPGRSEIVYCERCYKTEVM